MIYQNFDLIGDTLLLELDNMCDCGDPDKSSNSPCQKVSSNLFHQVKKILFSSLILNFIDKQLRSSKEELELIAGFTNLKRLIIWEKILKKRIEFSQVSVLGTFH